MVTRKTTSGPSAADLAVEAKAKARQAAKAKAKAKAKATIVSAPPVETLHTATPDTEATLRQRMFASIEEMLANGPSWKRILTAWAIGLATSIGLGYLGGYIAVVLALSAMLLTGSMFVYWLVLIVGVLIAVYGTYRASVFVHMSIIDKSVDRACATAWNKVTGIFRSDAPKSVAS